MSAPTPALPIAAPSTPPNKPSDKLTPPQIPIRKRLSNHLKTSISLENAHFPILLCCVISGLSDAASYNAWSAFIGMQTGNTVFLALGVSNQPFTRPYNWLKSLTAIVCFFFGCAVFANGMRLFGERRRGTLMGSFLLQSAFMAVAAGLVQAGRVPVPKGVVTPIDIDPGNPFFIDLFPVGLLAFQAGGQIVASRVLGFNEIPTIILTSVYCDVASDKRVLKGGNPKRDRRAIGAGLLLLGGIAGGWISRSETGLGVVFWIGLGLKLGIAIVWSFWKSE